MISKRNFVIVLVVLFFILIITLIQITFYDSIDTPQFLKDAKYVIRCDEHFLQSPTNCRIEDEHGILITENVIYEDMFDQCWTLPSNGHYYLPCLMD